MRTKDQRDPHSAKDAEKAAVEAARKEAMSEIEGDIAVSLIGDLPQFAFDLILQGVAIAGLPINLGKAVYIRRKPTPGTLSFREKVAARSHLQNDVTYLRKQAQAAAKKQVIHTVEAGVGGAVGTGITVWRIENGNHDYSDTLLQQAVRDHVVSHIPVDGAMSWYDHHNPALIDTVGVTALYLLSQVGRYAVQSAKVRNLSLRYYNASRGTNVQPR